MKWRKYPENSQSFIYNSTDNDGISTYVSFRVQEAEPIMLAKITGSETKTGLETVQDLTLVPNFSSGKTTVAFTFKAKGSAAVKILDTNLTPVFSDKVSSESFSRAINLPKNGKYYLTIKQKDHWFVRELIKE